MRAFLFLRRRFFAARGTWGRGKLHRGIVRALGFANRFCCLALAAANVGARRIIPDLRCGRMRGRAASHLAAARELWASVQSYLQCSPGWRVQRHRAPGRRWYPILADENAL